MGIEKESTQKEFICRPCGLFLDTVDLNKDGNCPYCESGENIYLNELLLDEEE